MAKDNKQIVTANNVNIAPLVEELVAYVKTKKAVNPDLETTVLTPKTSSPDWKLISGVLCNSILEWASQNNEEGKELIRHMQSDIGYLLKRLGLSE